MGAVTREDAERCMRTRLTKVDVELMDFSRVLLRCKKCGQHWSPNLLSGGRLPRGYWQCPNACNVK